MPKPPLPHLSQHEPILHPTAPLQHPWVLRAPVPLAHDVRRPQLELRRQLRGAGPLDVLFVVVGPLVRAAHRVDRVQGAEALGGPDAGELGDRGHAAGSGHAVAAEGEGVDFGEEDGVGARGLLLLGGYSSEGEDGGEEGEEEDGGGRRYSYCAHGGGCVCGDVL